MKIHHSTINCRLNEDAKWQSETSSVEAIKEKRGEDRTSPPPLSPVHNLLFPCFLNENYTSIVVIGQEDKRPPKTWTTVPNL
jgi:hypothetical protein